MRCGHCKQEISECSHCSREFELEESVDCAERESGNEHFCETCSGTEAEVIE